MLLYHLVNYRPPVGPEDGPVRPYSRERLVRWELAISADGRFRGLIDLANPSDKDARFGQLREVPHAGRTVAIAPAIATDDAQYVLGWADDKTRPARAAAAHNAFVTLSRRWAHEYPDDAVARAVVAFYDTGGPGQVPKPPKWASKETVLVTVDGRPATTSDTLWQLWTTVVEERKTGSVTATARRGLCIVCGQTGVLLNRMPQALPKALIPGAEQEVALVSANKPIHTYDFKEGLGTAPICVTCGQAAVTNLHSILEDRNHTFSYARQRTRMAWWTTHGGDSAAIALLDDKPTAIRDYFDHLHSTGPPRRLPQQRLCSMSVSANVARLVVGAWLEQPLDRAEANVRRWFDDHTIVQWWRDQPARFPIWLLVTCAGQWQPGASGGTGRYIELWDKAADRPDDLADLMLHAALHGARLPPHILAHIVRRVRTDGHIDEPRAALLRVALNRHPVPAVEAPMPGLDPNCLNPAYLAGRLFAVLESVQRAANTADGQPNTTFFDRYFSGAIANPRIAIIQGNQQSSAWLKKIRSTKPAAFNALRRRLGELTALCAASPFPARITTEEQSMFIIGYYHQRADDLARVRAGKAPELVAPEPEASDAVALA